MGLSSLLSLGQGALFSSQSAINTTGNNIANVNTIGYSRQAVRFEENHSIDHNPGQMGSGVKAAEVFRYFNNFVEKQFHDKSSLYQRWHSQHEVLSSVESLFNESNTDGISAMMNTFFKDWQDLASRPDNDATREALLAHSDNLVTMLRNSEQNLQKMQTQMDTFIAQEVEDANALMEQIAELNRQIGIHDEPGKNNANTLIDQRNKLVRTLAEKMDVTVIDNGGSDFSVMTKAGHTLVDGANAYSLDFKGPESYNELTSSSTFTGGVEFSGSDEYEYTLEVTKGGQVSNASSAATFRVSLDGGKTWLKNPDGTDKQFYARPESGKVEIEGIEVYFTPGSPANNMEVGDKFNIIPKSHLTWVTPTTKDLNISPQQFFDGTDNDRRLVGGKIAGYFSLRDHYVGNYKEKLNALAKGVIWEVNRLHSQGANSNKITSMLGTYSVNDNNAPLGSNASGLTFGDKLQQGNLNMYFYNSSTGKLAAANSFGPLDFSSIVPPGISNFDPAQHSITDVKDAINTTWGTYVSADVQDGKLVLGAKDGYDFKLGADSTGLTAALGLNTFFKGSSAADIAVREEVRYNSGLLNAGSVNGSGELTAGDNSTALNMAKLKNKKVSIETSFETSDNQSLNEYYNSLVAQIGAETSNADFNAKYNETLANDLNERQNEVAGVNLDEEMANLVKFQSSYKAAAKLITTADQMIQVLLGIKN